MGSFQLIGSWISDRSTFRETVLKWLVSCLVVSFLPSSSSAFIRLSALPSLYLFWAGDLTVVLHWTALDSCSDGHWASLWSSLEHSLLPPGLPSLLWMCAHPSTSFSSPSPPPHPLLTLLCGLGFGSTSCCAGAWAVLELALSPPSPEHGHYSIDHNTLLYFLFKILLLAYTSLKWRTIKIRIK